MESTTPELEQPTAFLEPFTSEQSLVAASTADEQVSSCLVDVEVVQDSADSSIEPRLQRPSSLLIPQVTEPINGQDTATSARSTVMACPNFQNNTPDYLTGDDYSTPQEEQMVSDGYAIGGQETYPVDSDGEGDFAQLGSFKPFWIPDQDALACMLCDQRFTVIKRRHHCRACGKVLCAACCNFKAKLLYMDNKEARVCVVCHPLLTNGLIDEDIRGHHHQNYDEGASGGHHHPDPSDPSSFCTTDSPYNQVQANAPPPTVFVPVGVLKRSDRPPRPESVDKPKQVVFSDGIRPGGDLTENEVTTPSSSAFVAGKRSGQSRIRSPSADRPSGHLSGHRKHRHNRTIVSDPTGPLPPIIFSKEVAANSSFENLLNCLRSEAQVPITFYLCKNLHCLAKVVKLDCCLNTEVWSFASSGLAAVGQDELAIIVANCPDETTVPRDVFRFLTNIYDSAMRGTVHAEMSHVLFTEGLFGSKENSGFIFVRPTFQCMSKLVKPAAPYMVAVLFHKFEVPWAKLFPLRLLLRLGVEYRCYPFPLVSYRNRKPAYFEVGHTILNVLADFKNFQYTLPQIPGLVVHRESKKTTIRLPRNRYDRIAKVLGSTNEHVLAFGSNFSLDADGHLTCVQNDEGQHQTHLISKMGTIPNCSEQEEKEQVPLDVTGASFVVFSGALKSTTGLTAKVSTVEDGVLVQITPSFMEALKAALADMKDYEVACGKVDEEPDEVVLLEWTPNDTYFNVGVRSPIDGRSLEGVNSVRIYNGTDYAGGKFLIRWTEVFFIENTDPGRRADLDPTKLAAMISQALCIALTPHLEHLIDSGLQKLALRVTLDPDKVGYEVGSQGQALPSTYINELDGALIPVIMSSLITSVEGLLVMELFFHVLLK